VVSWLTPVFGVGIFTAGPLEAPLASENDKPAAPNTGRALLLRFRFDACFERDMAATSYTFGQCSDQWIARAIREIVPGSIGRCLNSAACITRTPPSAARLSRTCQKAPINDEHVWAWLTTLPAQISITADRVGSEALIEWCVRLRVWNY
jgi:hypothetical protein